MYSLRPAFLKAVQISSSERKPFGSMLYLMDPLKMKGVWGIIPNCFLKLWNPISKALSPPILYIEPNSGYKILKSA